MENEALSDQAKFSIMLKAMVFAGIVGFTTGFAMSSFLENSNSAFNKKQDSLRNYSKVHTLKSELSSK